jgi:putative flippase GtrA
MSRLLDRREVRFIIVGGVNTVVGYAVFVALEVWAFGEARWGYAASLVGSYIVGILVGYLLYRRYVFDDRSRWTTSLPRFVLTNLVTLALNGVILALLVELAQMPRLGAQIVALVVTVIASYAGHSLFSFRSRSPYP